MRVATISAPRNRVGKVHSHHNETALLRERRHHPVCREPRQRRLALHVHIGRVDLDLWRSDISADTPKRPVCVCVGGRESGLNGFVHARSILSEEIKSFERC